MSSITPANGWASSKRDQRVKSIKRRAGRMALYAVAVFIGLAFGLIL